MLLIVGWQYLINIIVQTEKEKHLRIKYVGARWPNRNSQFSYHLQQIAYDKTIHENFL